MKKTIAVFLFVLLTLSILLTGACGKSKTPNETTSKTDASVTESYRFIDDVVTTAAGTDVIDQIYPDGAELPELTVSADQDEVGPGDMVTVTVSVSGAENLACLQFKLFYDDKVFTLYEASEADISGLISYSNTKTGQLIYTGFCSTTVDVIEEQPVFTFTLSVNDDAGEGEHPISCMVNQFMIGTDDDGETIGNLVDKKNLDSSVSITVE